MEKTLKSVFPSPVASCYIISYDIYLFLVKLSFIPEWKLASLESQGNGSSQAWKLALTEMEVTTPGEFATTLLLTDTNPSRCLHF